MCHMALHWGQRSTCIEQTKRCTQKHQVAARNESGTPDPLTRLPQPRSPSPDSPAIRPELPARLLRWWLLWCRDSSRSTTGSQTRPLLKDPSSLDIVALAFPQDMRKTVRHYDLLCPAVPDACQQTPKQAVRALGQLYASCTSKRSSACVKLSRGVACAPTQPSSQT